MKRGRADLLDSEDASPDPALQNVVAARKSSRIRLSDRSAQGVGTATAGPAATVDGIPIDLVILGLECQRRTQYDEEEGCEDATGSFHTDLPSERSFYQFWARLSRESGDRTDSAGQGSLIYARSRTSKSLLST